MTTAGFPVAPRIAGDTHVGKVRTTNEDSLIVEPSRGLYAVLDGMGGANAGDIASQTARDAVRDFVVQRRLVMEPKALLEAAIQAGCLAVWTAGQADKDRHGMGTTVVACLIVDNKRAIIAHAGDSRAYLLRNGRLQPLTRDHTIVEELVERGLLSAEDAERHPYKNVLSRNLGSKPETRVDVSEMELLPGDRLMLCSDGLYGYASPEGIQYVLGSGDAPDQVARDLIDLALRGGGGDNVSTIVIEAPAAPVAATTVVRTTGATKWWHQRHRFVQICRERGLADNPICANLEPDEALELVALSLSQAIFHDLEKATGVNVWTFASNLGSGWFDRAGKWAPLRELMDILAIASRTVVDEIRTGDAQVGFLLDVAVSRAMIVAELALGGLLTERLRQVDGDLIRIHAAMQETIDSELPTEDTGSRWIEQPTIPFMRPDRPVTSSGISVELMSGIEKALVIARGRTKAKAELVRQVLTALDTISTDGSGNFGSAVLAARELYGVRTMDQQGIMPLFDALDQARILVAASVHQIIAPEPLRAKVLAALSTAHQRLVGAMTGLVLEAVAPYSERLREVQQQTSSIRDDVASSERRRASLEKKLANTIDQSQPWERRGNTEW